MKVNQFAKSYYKTILWLVLMIYVLFTPGNALPENKILHIPHSDKIIHAVLFGGLSFLWLHESRYNSYFITYLVLFSLIIFAGLSEIIQHLYIYGRSGNVYDFIADLSGLVLALPVYYFIWKRTSVYKKFR